MTAAAKAARQPDKPLADRRRDDGTGACTGGGKAFRHDPGPCRHVPARRRAIDAVKAAGCRATPPA